MLRLGPIPAGELADKSGLTTGAITGVIDRLERAGYVVRASDPRDRRRVVVQPIRDKASSDLGPVFDGVKRATSVMLDRYSAEQLELLLEFLNRVDETVVFHALETEQLTKIVEIQLERLRARLTERRISLSVAPAALRYLGERGYDPVYGARPLKRLIQQEIETPMARQLVKGELHDGDTATVELKDQHIVIVPTVAG